MLVPHIKSIIVAAAGKVLVVCNKISLAVGEKWKTIKSYLVTTLGRKPPADAPPIVAHMSAGAF